jgi:DNA gyrase subunit B
MTHSSILVRALMAYSVHEHQEGFVRVIEVGLEPGGFTMEDDGRGIGLHRPGYVENLLGTLVGGAGPVQLHGVGLSLVAASVPKLSIESRRNGHLWTQSFAWGMPEGPVTREPLAEAASGTRIAVSWASGMPGVSAADLQPAIDAWTARNPGLTIRLR